MVFTSLGTLIWGGIPVVSILSQQSNALLRYAHWHGPEEEHDSQLDTPLSVTRQEGASRLSTLLSRMTTLSCRVRFPLVIGLAVVDEVDSMMMAKMMMENMFEM